MTDHDNVLASIDFSEPEEFNLKRLKEAVRRIPDISYKERPTEKEILVKAMVKAYNEMGRRNEMSNLRHRNNASV